MTLEGALFGGIYRIKPDYFTFRSATKELRSFAAALAELLGQGFPCATELSFSYERTVEGAGREQEPDSETVTGTVQINEESLTELLETHDSEGQIFVNSTCGHVPQESELHFHGWRENGDYIIFTYQGKVHDLSEGFRVGCASSYGWVMGTWVGSVLRAVVPKGTKQWLRQSARSAVEGVAELRREPYAICVEKRVMKKEPEVLTTRHYAGMLMGGDLTPSMS